MSPTMSVLALEVKLVDLVHPLVGVGQVGPEHLFLQAGQYRGDPTSDPASGGNPTSGHGFAGGGGGL